MELSDLSLFRAVVSAGGVTRAAERLHRVQSNVTTRVRKLEQELGVELFIREGRGMQLSAPGKVLLGYADRILALADEARGALAGEAPRSLLRLGAMESTAAVRLPGPLSELQRRHPEIAVELHTAPPQQMIAQVLAGELDAALVAEPVADTRLERRAIWDEALVLVTQAGHPPVRKPADLGKRTLLAFHPGCPHRQRLEDWFARGRLHPERIVEMASYHALLGCALVGMGVALMPRSVLDAYAERARLGVHPLSGPFRSARTLLVWRRDSPQRQVAALAQLLVSDVQCPSFASSVVADSTARGLRLR
jgi:DNA-binding transcriptional LysR family regulator